MKIACLLFGLMFVNYCLNAVSFRMVAKGSYLGLGITDALIAAFGFSMIHEVAHAQTINAFVGYVVGAVAGSLVGLWFATRIGD